MTPLEAPPQIALRRPSASRKRARHSSTRDRKSAGSVNTSSRGRVRRAERRQVGDGVEVLAGEDVPASCTVPNMRSEVDAPEVVDVLVEDVEPGAVRRDPVEARHLDVDVPRPPLASRRPARKSTGSCTCSSDVAQHDPLGAESPTAA